MVLLFKIHIVFSLKIFLLNISSCVHLNLSSNMFIYPSKSLMNILLQSPVNSLMNALLQSFVNSLMNALL